MTMAVAVARVGGIRRRRSRVVTPVIVGLFVAAVAAVVTIPVAIIVVLSFQSVTPLFKGGFTLANFSALLGSSTTWETLGNTLIFTAGGTALAMFLGTVTAWAMTSVNVPLRSILSVLPVCILILPPLVKDPSWIILFGKDNGLVNLFFHHVFGVQGSVVDVFTMTGMVLMAGVFTSPTAYAILLTPLRSVDRSLLEASQMSGAKLGRTLWKVVLPLIRPALLSAATLTAILIASGFETPVIIGLPARINMFIAEIYESISSPVNGLNYASAQASVYLVLTTVLVIIYLRATRNERRFAAVSGRGHQHTVIQAPVLRWVLFAFVSIYAIVGFLAPLAVTVLTAFLPYYSAAGGKNPFHDWTLANFEQVFTTPQVTSAILTSGALAATVALGVLVITVFLSVVALKTRARGRRIAEIVGMAPIATPALVYSVALLMTVLAIPGLARVAYGTIGLMYVAELVVFIPVALRLVSSSVIQVQDELLEASRMSGASYLRTIMTVLIPIIRPALFYAGGVLFIEAYRQLASIVLLVASNVTLVPFVSWTFWVSGGYPMLSALNVVTLVLPLLVAIAAVGVGNIGRRGATRRPADSETAPVITRLERII
ncbi:MAG TPA: iron ABC transporter permease [Galbitalea sp.]|jgi:iron(III) transport system permease protein